MSKEVYVGRDVSDLQILQEFQPITKVIAYRSDEQWFEAGTDTGRTIEFTSPWASQAMANSVLQTLNGYVYRPYEATGAILPIDAEIGDAVNVADLYGIIANQTVEFNALTVSDISAPGDEDLNHEYPFIDFKTREENRENKRLYSLITKTDTEIRLLVANEVEGLQSSITLTANEIRAEVQDEVNGLNSSLTQTASSLTSQINAVDGRVSTVDQRIDSITLSVSNSESSSTISLDIDGIAVQSKKIQFTGDIVFASDLTDGQTTISGNNIQTGTIAAEYLDVSGAITATLDDGINGISFVNSRGNYKGGIIYDDEYNRLDISSNEDLYSWVSGDTLLEWHNVTMDLGNYDFDVSSDIIRLEPSTKLYVNTDEIQFRVAGSSWYLDDTGWHQ